MKTNVLPSPDNAGLPPDQSMSLSLTESSGTHGLHRTASTLKLDYYSLKKRVEAVASSRDKNDAPFLELPAVGSVPTVSVPECVIEIEEGPVRWRVQLKPEIIDVDHKRLQEITDRAKKQRLDPEDAERHGRLFLQANRADTTIGTVHRHNCKGIGA